MFGSLQNNVKENDFLIFGFIMKNTKEKKKISFKFIYFKII